VAVRRDGPFPRLSLPDLDGVLHPLEETWAQGEALVLIGHRNCKTTRQTIPFVDRIHRRRSAGHSVLVVLEDDVPTVLTLIADQGLAVPIHLEPDPYPLAAALELVAVPTLFLIDRKGTIAKVTEAFNRADLEEYAARLGNDVPLFAPEDKAPATRPGCIPKEPAAR
jgi:peroxiredoxin